MITSLLSKDGQLFYIKGSLFKTSKMSLQEKINNLKDAYNLKLQNFADALGMSPQQFSYKITHKLSLEDIKNLSNLLNLNDSQIVNLFIK